MHHHDVRNGLIWLAIVAPFGMWAAAVLAERLAPPGAALGPRAVPAVALSLALVVPVLTIVSNQLSRDVERRADAFSLELTRDPAHVHRLPASGSRSRTSPTPTRPRSPASCSAPTRRRCSGSGMAEAFER